MVMIMLGVIIVLLGFIALSSTGLWMYFKRAAAFASRKLASFAEVDFDSEVIILSG